MRKLICVFTYLSLAIPCSADIIYVKEGGTGSGTSWADPNGILQCAINNANSDDEVWVAAGTYKPTMEVGGTGDRYKTFQMKNGVKIYGGFPDTGNPDMTNRDPNQYETILSGDIGAVSDDSDNCYHVFYHPSGTDLDETAILDGFTITAGNGNSDKSDDHDKGGGMYNYSGSPIVTNCTFTCNSAYFGCGMYNRESSPIVTNNIFTDNTMEDTYGGGMCNEYSSNPTVTNCKFLMSLGYIGGGMCNMDSSPTITNCTFNGNSTWGNGGGMFIWGGSPTLSSCTFTGNSSYEGGGISQWVGESTLINCTINQNIADDWWGGGMSLDSGTATLTNCTFTGNTAGNYGGGLYNFNGSPIVTNCILWGNTPDQINGSATVNHSNIQGGWGNGTGNINAEPNFVDPGYWDPNDTPGNPSDDFWVDGDYHLKSQAGRWDTNTQSWVHDSVTSPCIDAGDPASSIGWEPYPNGGVINMGAYGGTEYASKSYFGAPVCNKPIAGDINGDCKVDMVDFSIMALHWLEDNNP